MNSLIEAKLKTTDKRFVVKIYRHNKTQTGLHLPPNQPKIFDVELEAFYYAMQKKGYEVVETTRQTFKREFGNSELAYEITKFENGHVVGMVD